MILDTVALSRLMDGEQAISRRLSSSTRHHLTAIVLGEYRFGLLKSTKRKPLESALAELIEHSEMLVVDSDTSRHYADIRLELESRGTPIPMNDYWIAALARQHGLPVVSKDAHFGWVSGVKWIGW